MGGILRHSDESSALEYVDPSDLDDLPIHPTQHLRLDHLPMGRSEPYVG